MSSGSQLLDAGSVQDGAENPIIAEIELLKQNFNTVTERIVKDIQRHDRIMTRSDKYQKQQYDELQARLQEVESLQQEIEETQKEVVFTLGAIGESRSRETGNHVKRVAEYSRLFALFYGLSESEAEMLKQASPMHDIGKIAIPDAILNKPGKLTDEEFVTMKTHAELGYEMLKYSKRPLLKLAATIAYQHHEKYDGSGYPRGIAGAEISIFGRITALADVFDALGSDRCYKKAWDDDKIFAFFREQSGRHFDPRLVDIFFAHLDAFLAIRDAFKDE